MIDPAPASTVGSEAWPKRSLAWWTVVVLAFAYAVSILDRVALGFLVTPIEADLHLSDTQIGLLQGAGFAIFFAILGYPIGVLADRMNRKLLLAVGMVVWSLATMASGLSSGFASLLAARVTVGAGEAVLAPAGTSMIGDYFPPAKRPKAFAIYALGASVGSGLAFLTVGAVLRTIISIIGHGQAGTPHPWQWVFFLLGAPGLFLALMVMVTVREPARRELASPEASPPKADIVSHLGRHARAYTTLYGAAVAYMVALYVILGWFPTFVVRAYHVKIATTASIMGMIALFCGVTSSIAGGWIIAFLYRRGHKDAAIIICAVSLPLIALGVLVSVLSGSFVGAMGGYAFTSLILNVPAVAVLTGINRITPNGLRAQALAVHTIFTSVLSQTMGPLLVGLLADRVFAGPRGLGYSMALVISVTCCLATIAIVGFHKQFSQANQLMTNQLMN